RRAHGPAGVEVGEPEAAVGEGVEVGGEGVGAAVGAEVAVAEVVGEDDDDVGAAAAGLRRRAAGEEGCEQPGHHGQERGQAEHGGYGRVGGGYGWSASPAWSRSQAYSKAISR